MSEPDAPEQEMLNLSESITCARVSLAYMDRANRNAMIAAAYLANALRPLMDDHMEPAE